ncbi:xanthine dehydrogenase family protein molybdopterin-binding subunit [Aestuariivirga sp. YIM B02566]|uniref:Xanthine dehydrogenase family protein molybdopterin-binding subunit n=1 Tax=Taklimakanibacter albus TaxID=2800327 RepID=A0ACC5QXR2_9HYPH|nr:xanthine dehydrogenase family protein molybdopterin-binding subunit [Aestuariivirga sp. YIM B02566]
MMDTGIGARVRRKEDHRFITGKGQYTDDINLKDQTYAYFVRSPHAHATIKSIKEPEWAPEDGVVAVFTGEHVAEDKIGGLICGWMIHSKDGSPMKAGPHPILAQGKARYVGDHVAVVIAETKEQAKAAAARVDVTYGVLPHVVDVAKATKSKAQIHDVAPDNTVFEWSLGDKAATEAAFQRAHHVTKLDLVNNRLIPNAMEPRAAIGSYDSGSDHYTLYTTSQNPHVARLVISAFHGLAPEHKLRVIAPDVGGGFGSKIFIYAEEVVCVWASKRIGGRPIKWTAERTESFLADAHGRDHVTHAELAMDKDGHILGLKCHTLASMGAYLSTFASCVPTYLYATLLSGQYAIPAIYAEVDAIYTNTAPVDAYRGAGRPEATYLVERIVETAAREMKIDPAEFRRRNFVTSFPHQTPVIMTYDAGDYDASLKKALEIADYKGFPARKAAAAKQGKLRGIGFANYIEACGIAPSAAVGSLGAGVGLWESAEVRVNPVGTIEVLTGSHSHGQGHETTFAQLVSDRLGVDINSVAIVHGDTDKVQFGMGTYGSRSGAVGMSAISKALDKVEAKARKIAAHVMEAAEGDIEFKNGSFSVKGTDKKMAFGEVALAAYVAHKFPTSEIEPGLKETAFYDPSNFTFPAGCHICEVEIDTETGVTEIVSWTAVDDFGTVINPMIVEGQVHGGITQGIGQALTEGCVYDSESGQLLTGSYMDYCMPRATDVPSFKLGFTETKCPSNPLGMKGCGEAGAIAAPAAVMNAMTDALGVKDLAMPASPHTVWKTLQATKMAAE